MNRRIFMSVHECEEDLLGVVKAVRQQGLKIVDIYTPYPVHGLDRAAGFGPSRLPWICFVLGLLGAGLKVWFEFWTTAQDWPINVGGKPWDSLPAFIPVTFEVMVLFAGVGTVIALFIATPLYPGKKAVTPFARTTDDRFALLLEEEDATFDPDQVRMLCERYNAVRVEEREEKY
ncbi:MAG: DUF3341 domain-containing protein [Candidatus Omnitrophica bacterium]|nr:MAG: hypothetical protein UZ16_OP3001002824 [Candidatus Hinthialibacteria bacterium OLB16]MBE7486846.1 DUF3341 domain-containing protein [bacterium]MBK7495428.1 DUF3341 domain-containing protein [Candidatus Omnitrophota bacterium]MCE7906764.1 DUF3341 domain-containing protein [Candidatus Omnitrophica bacterium COP1]MBV6480350.1 hypothetical protein [bacterium]